METLKDIINIIKEMKGLEKSLFITIICNGLVSVGFLLISLYFVFINLDYGKAITFILVSLIVVLVAHLLIRIFDHFYN